MAAAGAGWGLAAAPRFSLRSASFSKARGQGGVPGQAPGRTGPGQHAAAGAAEPAPLERRFAFFQRVRITLTKATRASGAGRQSTGTESSSTISLWRRGRRRTSPTPTEIKKSEIQHPLPLDIELLIRRRLISSYDLNPQKLILFS